MNEIVNKNIEKIKKSINKYENKIEELNKQLYQEYKEIKIICPDCKCSFPIKDVTFLQYFYFDGEAYNERYVPTHAHYICPYCKREERFKNEEEKYKKYFKEIVERY